MILYKQYKEIMKKTLTAIAFALPLLAVSTVSFAEYQIRIGMETPQGGSLPQGTISFGNGGAVTPPVEPTEPEPEEPSIPQEPEIEGKTFLYKATLGSTLSTGSSNYLYPTQPLSGSPLLCGENYNANCFVISAGVGFVVFTYQGTDVNYAKNFPIGDLIVVKSGLFNTTAECPFISNNSIYIDSTILQVKLTYRCLPGSLPYPAKIESPATVDPRFSVSFYKKK